MITIRCEKAQKQWCEIRGINFGHGKCIRPSIIRSYVQYPFHLSEKIGEYSYQYFKYANKNPFPTDMSVNECLNAFDDTDKLMDWIEFTNIPKQR